MKTCQVHGCEAEGTEQVSVAGHPDLTARVCKAHKQQHDEDGWLGGLVIPDDEAAYLEQITLKPEI